MDSLYTLTENRAKWEDKYVSPIVEILRNSDRSVIFLRGISGSGKTTLSQRLSNLLGSNITACCSADNYFIVDGTYTFDISKISEAHRSCLDSMEKALCSANIRYIIIDNTHTRMWHLLNAENLANQHNVNIYYLDIIVPDGAHFSVCLKRQSHNVSEEVLLDQWLSFEENPKSMKIPMFISEEKRIT